MSTLFGSRRQFLATALGSGMVAISGGRQPRSGSSLVESISRDTLWSNRDGRQTTWFHPRACMVPRQDQDPLALMTLQTITGSDYFGPVHFSTSADQGAHWSDPRPIDAFGRKPVPGHKGLEQGVCDVVPEYHPQTNTVLAVGHIVFYRGPKFSKNDQLARFPVYSVRYDDGSWSPLKKLAWNDPRGGFIYTNNCGQRVVLPNGDIQMAFTFGPQSDHRSVAGVICSFDGKTLSVKSVGKPVELKHKRGLLEPSVTRFGDSLFMTVRAEDGHGYVCRSRDGLNWSEKKAWCWEDGDPVAMSTTQQHWLTHSEGLFLVYTRRDRTNANVIRWRAPLFLARVDPGKLTLDRESERVVQPLVGDGVNDPDSVPLMGNFHVTHASPRESWVTVGSWLPRRGATGAVHLARIHWAKPNGQW